MNGLEVSAISASCGLLGAIGFRGAGGLFSQWAGRDLGDTFARQAWGICAAVAIIPAAVSSHWHWYITLPIVIAASTLTGVMRGIGWGNSLTLGHSSVGVADVNKFCQDSLVMWTRLTLMAAFPFIAIIALKPSWHAVILSVIGCMAASLQGLTNYVYAWGNGGFNIPALGCSRNDPPPTGELLSGFFIALFAAAVGLGL